MNSPAWLCKLKKRKAKFNHFANEREMSLKAQKDKPNLKLAAELPPNQSNQNSSPPRTHKLTGSCRARNIIQSQQKQPKILNTTEALKATLQENQRQTET